MIEAVLVDIEGTTSSISFVRDVLFPYAYDALPAFLAAHAAEPDVAELVQQVRAEGGLAEAGLAPVVDLLRRWISEDRKSTPLKTLQGMIWEAGYADGAYKAHLYEDAWRALKAWHDRGMRLYVYSSGSVRAQELFFGHTVYGDINDWFAGRFDTTTGPKQSPDSYRAIAAQINLAPARILFLSDAAAELDAAAAAGMHTRQLVRPADGTVPAAGHANAASFDDIVI